MDRGNLIVMFSNFISLTTKSIVMKDIDSVPSNVQSASHEALLYVFEDNEAVIKMIMKGRSPTMRHVLQNPQSCSWLVVRSNQSWPWDSNQIHRHQEPTCRHLDKREFHTWWMESFVDLVQYHPFWLYSLHRCNGKTSSTRIRRKTCHSQITTHDEFDRKNAFVRVFFSLIQTRGGPRMDIKILENLFQVTIETGRPVEPSRPDYIQEDCGRSLVFSRVEKWSCRARSIGETWGNFLGHIAKSWPHREEPLLGRNAHSARYGELIHDRTGETCVSASPRTGLFWKFSSWAVTQQNLWTKSKTKCETDRKECRTLQSHVTNNSTIWGMFMATTLNAATFMGKEFLNYSKCCQESWKSHLETDVRCHSAVSQQSGRNQLPGQNSVWEEFLDTSVINWWWNSHQSSKHKSPCILRFCVVSRKGSSTSRIQRSLEEQSCRSPSREKLQRLWCYQRRVDWIRVEHFPQDSQRCSSVIKSVIFWAIWDKHQKLSQEEFYLCRCSMTSPVTETTTKMNV